MPKVKSKPSKKLIDLVNEYGSDILSTDNTVLFCKACGKTINHEKKYFVYQHLQTAKHKSATEKINTFVADSSSKSQFPTELCMAFIDAGIPLWKLENKSLRSFLEKYTKQHIPSESSLRKHYIDNNFNNVMDRVRREVAYNKIWISIDETIDPVGRFVANVVIGTLEADQPSKEYLLTSEVLEKSNSSTIAQLFTSSLAVLWPEGIRHENVLLFVTDAAPYMKKAAGALKVLFPNMLHLTCLAHGLTYTYISCSSKYTHKDWANGKKLNISYE
ncbi:CGG triplet repeat-binding protein 1 [Trichinella sp. T6]|nr:CGG triplet repeat-binding protein 1 [Trichinella sp. T6]